MKLTDTQIIQAVTRAIGVKTRMDDDEIQAIAQAVIMDLKLTTNTCEQLNCDQVRQGWKGKFGCPIHDKK